MTDRTDHLAEAERLLADADEWGWQAEEPTPEVGELSCLAYAQVHALLAIADALTAADRYAANEAKQREGQMEDAWQSRDWESVRRLQDEAEQREKAQPKIGSADWAQQFDDMLDEEEPCESEWLSRDAADPLDEDDRRDRMDSDGGTWRMSECGYWHLDGAPRPTECPCWQTLARVNATCGPLAFAPEAAQDTTGDDLSASESESGAEEREGVADDAVKLLLCRECGHGIDVHSSEMITDPPGFSVGGFGTHCECELPPSGIARAGIEAAVRADAEFSRLLAVSTDPTAALRRAATMEAVGVTDDQAKLFAQILARGRLLPRDLQRLKAAVEQAGGGHV